jgi:indole-3-glycerol phosphate synthase
LALLLAVALDQKALVALIERATSIGLTPLVECHTAEEVDRAVVAGAQLVGINARDLRTLEVDLTTFDPAVPDSASKGVVAVVNQGLDENTDPSRGSVDVDPPDPTPGGRVVGVGREQRPEGAVPAHP